MNSNGRLSEIVASSVLEPSKRKPLIDLCKTRCAERYSEYFLSMLCFHHQVTCKGLHKDELSNTFGDSLWDRDSKSTANSLLPGLNDFEFIAVFLTVITFFLALLLQSTALDIIDAYQQIEEIYMDV